MAVTKPLIFTSVEDAEVVANNSVSEETVRKMIQNSNLLASLALIGTIRTVALNQPGASAPNGDIFQLANGGEITHPQSPLATVIPTNRFTPDLLNKYLRGAADDTNNNSGGSPTVNLQHDHGGNTATVSAPPLGAEGGDRYGYDPLTHLHTISDDMSTTEPNEVAHQEVAVYLKIN